MTDPIKDTETLSEEPRSIDPETEQKAQELVDEMESEPEATIVYAGGSEVVTGFTKLEEKLDTGEPYPDMADEARIEVIRVWHGDEYVDYDYGTIVEVNP